MHEVSLAGGILKLVETTRAREGFARVTGLHLQVGSLAGVDARALVFALQAAAPGTILEGASVHIEEAPGRAFCFACGDEVSLNARGDGCPACGGFQLQPTAGTELRVREIEVQDA